MSEQIHIAIMAYNEAANIERCIKSIESATAHPSDLRITVVINGSTDETHSIVLGLADSELAINIIDIPLADKANAWNTYVHGQIDTSVDHFFMDGDVWLPAGSIDYIKSHWSSDEYAAASPLPIGVSESYRCQLRDNRWLAGAMYGLSSAFLTAIREKEFRLPVGFIGDDSAITYIIETDCLDTQQCKKGIQILPATGPVVPRLGYSLATLRLLHRRFSRYAERHFQQEALYQLGRSASTFDLPRHVRQLAPHIRRLGLKKILAVNGIQTLYQPWAYFKAILPPSD
ncbi:glycosyltransferase [Congregibacter brevis]|uniref:Glycosyltransferase n=1 Tax=Congregibacter brevis TaxID=3081201 RepID=A0ABZ0IJR4_9GAMM|nr:glycosyltransferase [Congregibacter sp. IMCC45268]